MTSLTNVSPQLRRAWHPVGRVESFGSTPTRIELVGEAYVVVRLGDTVKAFLDVCPHRNARLSDGLVTEGCLRCPYHGWEFDAEGAVAHVPALGADATLPPARLAAPFIQE
ncbi:MAG: Rieske 2Fe-2S domain-containing protein, partial [Actinomycetes bacterium]